MKNGIRKRNIKSENVIMPFDNQKDENIFHSKCHTLCIEDVAAMNLPVEDEEGIVPGLFEEIPAYRVYRFYIGDFDESGTELNVLLNKFTKINESDFIDFCIDSNGGSVNEGKLFFNIINRFNEENVIAELNTGYSMGALLFCMASTRIVHEFSDLMFHDYSTMMWGKAGDIETNHKHSSKHIRNFFKSFILDKGFLSEEEFEQMMIGKEFWMDTEEMCRRGIATNVRVRNALITAEDYLKNLEEKRNPKSDEIIEKPKRKPRKKKSDNPETPEDLMKEIDNILENIKTTKSTKSTKSTKKNTTKEIKKEN